MSATSSPHFNSPEPRNEAQCHWIQALIQAAGLDINKKLPSGDTLLIMAVKSNLFHIAAQLLENGANPFETQLQSEAMAIDFAIQHNHISLVTLLLKHMGYLPDSRLDAEIQPVNLVTTVQQILAKGQPAFFSKITEKGRILLKLKTRKLKLNALSSEHQSIYQHHKQLIILVFKQRSHAAMQSFLSLPGSNMLDFQLLCSALQQAAPKSKILLEIRKNFLRTHLWPTSELLLTQCIGALLPSETPQNIIELCALDFEVLSLNAYQRSYLDHYQPLGAQAVSINDQTLTGYTALMVASELLAAKADELPILSNYFG